MAEINRTVDLFLWCVSSIYSFAFASLYVQIPGLYGSKGILPANLFLQEERANSGKNALRNLPTLLWYGSSLGLDDVASSMDLLCLLGAILSFSCCVSRTFRRSKASFALLWILYFSLYQVGQTFLWFQWDILLLETGFLTIFLAPDVLFDFDNKDKKASTSDDSPSPSSSDYSLPPSSSLFLFLVRWLLFRLMFASGVVKLTSRCPTWWSLTALDWHYESQCIPTPLAWFFRRGLPAWFHRLCVVATYVIEIPIPFLFFAPIRNLRLFAFWSQILFQALIIFTGNYNFFNLLTMTLCLSLVDDDFFGKSSPSSPPATTVDGAIRKEGKQSEKNRLDLIADKFRPFLHPYVSVAIYALLFAYVVKLFDLRLRSSSSSSSSSSLPFVVHSRIAFSESDFFSTLKSTMPLTIYLGVVCFLLQVGKVASTTFSLLKKGRDGSCRVDLVWRLGQVLQVAMSVLIASLLFTISLVPHTVVDEAAGASIPPTVRRLHARFQPYHITSSYGLFRRMTGVGGRPEVIIEGTHDVELNDMTIWEEFEFSYKPGDISRRPPIVAPHQPRLDWQMWFAALGSYHHNPWFVHLVYRLLTHEPEVLALLDADYAFKDIPPKFVRATLYHYRYTDYGGGGVDGGTGGGSDDDGGGNSAEETKDYWLRERRGSYFPIVDAEDPGLVNYLKGAGIISSPSSSPNNDFLRLEAIAKLVRSILSKVGGFQLCFTMFLLEVSGRLWC